MFRNYGEVIINASERLKGVCNVCPDCNGIACKGKIPGCGGKGDGSSFIEARQYLKSVKIKIDAVHPDTEINTRLKMFGTEFMYPIFVAPIGGMSINYQNLMNEETYDAAVLSGALESGICAFTGDGPKEEIFWAPLPMIKKIEGFGIPTIKPWPQDKCISRIRAIEDAHAIAFAMDIDSANLINLKLMGKPVYTKSTEELRELAQCTSMPFIVKGVLSEKAAEKCAEAGCYGIVVSNHGGRVMEDNPAPASMLPAIRAAVGDNLKIFVDGGIRSGADVFKCLALGADAVLIGRPYVTAVFGGLGEGVKMLTKKLGAELSDVMKMTDCADLKSINMDKIIIK